MEYPEVLKHLAPCGLDCSRCADCANGEIKELSARLLELLTGYQRVAQMKAAAHPEFGDYEQFEKILAYFSKGMCGGCRSDNVRCFVTCAARTCHRERGVDFCFQCPDYPCDKEFFAPLKKNWRIRNDRMKEIGVVEYFNEYRKMPRY